VNLRQLECFFAVADELHFGRAAEVLHLGQASVSEAVGALERSLGAPLFRRTTRRVELTAFGEQFLLTARPAFDQLREAYNAARQAHHVPEAFVVGHTPELGHLIFPRLIAKLAGTDAGAATRWIPRLLHTHQQISAIAEGSVDLGICWQAEAEPPLRSTVLARCPFVAIMRSDDPLEGKPSLRMADLRGRRLLVSRRSDNRFIDSRVESALVAAGMSTKCLDEIDRYDELAVNVASGQSIGLHPATVLLINRVPGLAFREIEDPVLQLDISVISRMKMGEGQSRFVEVLRRVALEALADVLDSLATPGVAAS
jgi:DNA-binding transcriptional LysR family regulator